MEAQQCGDSIDMRKDMLIIGTADCFIDVYSTLKVVSYEAVPETGATSPCRTLRLVAGHAGF